MVSLESIFSHPFSLLKINLRVLAFSRATMSRIFGHFKLQHLFIESLSSVTSLNLETFRDPISVFKSFPRNEAIYDRT